MAEYKKQGNCKYLIVMGCLVERYSDNLKEEMPEVDLFIKINEYDKFWNRIEALVKLNKKQELECNKFDYDKRVITTGNKTAYLKIAEGCSNRCTYCAIPYIRGKFVSRPMEDILKEAKKLADDGISEIILIAQDTTKYGIDIYGKPKLAKLLEEVCIIDEFKWVRFLYAYPESITDELIEVVKKNDKICKYFDIPIQHISDKILKTMNRKSTSKDIYNLIEKIKKAIPDSILRTSLIVGFPGETEEDFSLLYKFVQDIKFDKLRSIHVFKRRRNPSRKAPKSGT
jgi:ribosomal protein S12 methylthiotransferase